MYIMQIFLHGVLVQQDRKEERKQGKRGKGSEWMQGREGRGREGIKKRKMAWVVP